MLTRIARIPARVANALFAWRLGVAALAVVLLAVRSLELAAEPAADSEDRSQVSPLEQLGAQLFFDANLSRHRTQSCATCHDPSFAFADPRGSDAGRAVSVGDDGTSLGDRNAPTLMYARFAPPLTKRPNGTFAGGLFWDGRADTLEEQAKGPLFSPIEMGMPDARSLAARIAENDDYVARFKAEFGADVLADPDRTLDAVTRALAAHLRTSEFAPFDSKFDRSLRGEAKLSSQEEFGRVVFLALHCSNCHRPMRGGQSPLPELFTGFEYHNIGLPVNAHARAANGKGDGFVDPGLKDGTRPADRAQSGKFKVPTLRNVAVTAPYMHNGIFNKLRTAIQFYNKYTSRRPEAQINPETGGPWGDPEVAETISHADLKTGVALDNGRIAALEAFLKTLTDKRYEHLLDD